ncbi:MAG: hypothetical protein HZA91_01295 [Verrucomicrobia bacterium]|nr:hypothetical protein [Verrucomicrobiota bacterium]
MFRPIVRGTAAILALVALNLDHHPDAFGAQGAQPAPSSPVAPAAPVTPAAPATPAVAPTPAPPVPLPAATGDIWQPGRLREVLLHGITNDTAALSSWVAAGANSCIGVAPATAHKAGLKARGWFAMNYMDDRSIAATNITLMAAVARDKTLFRPAENPLVPDLSKHGWSACVNNPTWRASASTAMAKMAVDDYDGCHVDYASHLEACFCQHCKTQWQAVVKKNELTGMAVELEGAADAKDFRTRMLLREFRVRSVMEFLGSLRDAARQVKGGFMLDANLHQDSGSLYQCAYGDHVGAVCIEGATWGEFPPASQQILALKLVRAVSGNKVPLAVSYHTLRDREGRTHHARMAPDRFSVAMAETFSVGSASWLGWGGLGVDNLMREHEARAKTICSFAARLEPSLTAAKPMAWLAVVFSPRSYFADNTARAQYFVAGQALMRAHIPFAVLSDAGLSAEQLRGFTGVLLLESSALSDAAIAALDPYVKGGGKLMIVGDTARVDENWKDRAKPPAWAPTTDKPLVYGQGIVHPLKEEIFSGQTLGATQNVSIKQDRPELLVVEGWSRAQDVVGARGPDYAIVVDLRYEDDTNLTGLAAEFTPGTHDWEYQRLFIRPEKAVRRATVRLVFRGRSGTAWFREVRLGEWNNKTQRMSRNLLGTTLKPASGKSYTAKPIGDGDKGAFQPFRDGFTVETFPGLGHVVKVTSTGGLPVGQMHVPQPDIAQRIRQVVAPLLPAQPLVTLQGAGADNVYCDTSFTGDQLLIQFLNYNAQLSKPEQPEADQVKNDKTVPVANLKVTLGVNLRPTGATWSAPGIEPQPLPITPPLTFTLPRLDHWAVVTVQLK